jgi:hypothetical protein
LPSYVAKLISSQTHLQTELWEIAPDNPIERPQREGCLLPSEHHRLLPRVELKKDGRTENEEDHEAQPQFGHVSSRSLKVRSKVHPQTDWENHKSSGMT